MAYQPNKHVTLGPKTDPTTCLLLSTTISDNQLPINPRGQQAAKWFKDFGGLSMWKGSGGDSVVWMIGFYLG